MSTADRTRWSERWLGVIESTGAAFAQRLSRGRYFARKGVVHDLTIEPGHISARVRDSRTHPYTVEITVPSFDEADWDRATGALAGELRFTARLLDGELPDEVDEALEPVGLALFPAPDQVTGACTCAETRMPCKHVAAVHYRVADRMDEDPFVLLQLRGRDRETLLAALRSERSGGTEGVARAGIMTLEDLATIELTSARGDLDAVTVHPERVRDPAALFERLGDPPGVDDTGPFELMIGRAAEFAWRLAAGEGSDAADDELLVAELRAQRMASSESVATALGWDEERTREALDRLFEAGIVMRTGSGDRTRYRA